MSAPPICTLCGSASATPSSVGTESWWWIMTERTPALAAVRCHGPFCTVSCRDRFPGLPDEEKARCIVGDVWAEALLTLNRFYGILRSAGPTDDTTSVWRVAEWQRADPVDVPQLESPRTRTAASRPVFVRMEVPA